MKVAYQGEPGAYSEAAALAHFKTEIEPVSCESFDAVFAAVESGDCERGLVPIENSLAGSIHRNYDLLLRHSLSIVGEYYLNVQHCLIALPGVSLGEVRKVISHPQALAQCERHLKELPGVDVVAVHDTAGSVRLVRDQGDRSVAAIASRRAAEVYGLAVLASNFEDDPHNYTRFLEIAAQPLEPQGPAKTSIVFTLRNQPGALFKGLSVFALRDIDLTKIESRPLVGQPFEYLFYIDFAGSTAERSARRALEHLDEYALMLRVLGSYPRGR
ncbi:MAG: prephenate dehydratase [Chloroflexota bacterium]